MTHDDLQIWLDRYVDAWRTSGPTTIAALFSTEATYAYQPWATPLRGRDAIVADWLKEPDEPDSWEAEYRPLTIEGDRATAIGTTRYANGKTFHNLFVMTFNGAGECTDFVEWYMLHS